MFERCSRVHPEHHCARQRLCLLRIDDQVERRGRGHEQMHDISASEREAAVVFATNQETRHAREVGVVSEDRDQRSRAALFVAKLDDGARGVMWVRAWGEHFADLRFAKVGALAIIEARGERFVEDLGGLSRTQIGALDRLAPAPTKIRCFGNRCV